MTAAPGRRQAAVLEHLAAHPGATAGEMARVFGVAASLYKPLAVLERRALVVGVPVWDPGQGREVKRWRLAPPGTVPPPRPAPDPVRVALRNERDRKNQNARRARARALTAPPAPERRPLRGLPAAGACRTADPDLFFGPDAERVTDCKARVAKAKAVCAGCPVREACLAYAMAAGEPYGIWGGLTEDERRALRRQRRAS
ncbi:MAG TPA: WhiB family transcriptional regulator [Streptosporangiaceae bacterium]